MTHRRITAVRAAGREDIADLQTRMALTDPTDTAFDPFLLLAHHGPQTYPANNGGLPFGPHPHRGFETVTFVLDGALVHADSAGHQSMIGPGGVQWMTAGAGVVHSETAPASFRRHGGPLEILQLWVNLPSALKMTEPRYTGVQASAIPVVPLGTGGSLHLVSGMFDGHAGPIQSLTDVFIAMAAIKANHTVDLPSPADRTVLFYVVRGEIDVDGRTVSGGQIASFDANADTLSVTTTDDALILFGHADSIGEPVVARGPFVMTSTAEIDQANRDYRAGKFADAPLSVELG